MRIPEKAVKNGAGRRKVYCNLIGSELMGSADGHEDERGPAGAEPLESGDEERGSNLERQPQVLRLTTPELHPTNEDLFVGTPDKLNYAWGPVRSG